MDVNEIEKNIEDFWKKDKTFEKSMKKNKGKDPYVFYDGPPFATGMPHYGHILGSVTKDIFGRYHTMQGKFVRRVWGWDCHGLPIENIAEKGLGINSKDEIEKMGIAKFNQYCRSKVMGYVDAWKETISRVGRWVDMDNSYKTMDNEYIESVWWAFKQLYEKGYIYKGEKILMYCPRCATPLAKAEIAMDNSYKTVKDETVVVKFKLKKEDAYALAWTTTPWTLPSNLALTVNPKLKYVYIKDKKYGETYLLGKDTVERYYKDKEEYEIVKEVLGSKLEGLEYEPLFDYFKNEENAFKILLADFVNAEDGTGIVHTAPAFGEDDYAVCQKYGIKLIQPVDEKGKFTKEVKDFAGEFIHDTNRKIIDFLKLQKKVAVIRKMDHEYPFCYRCDTKLMYRAIPAWFVDIQKIKPKLLKISQKINWYPEFLRAGRVKYTIETAPDWNISRNRYWAAALPIWMNEDGEIIVIGSVEELKKYAKKMPKREIDLHKDYLDEVVLEKDGKQYRRVPEVFDCWFESGAMTFAQFHYPFENKEEFEKSFPSQFVAEYIAQTRTWFYYMMVLSAILFDDMPFENVVTTGTILAEDGEKMSKSKNNFTDPLLLIDKYGVDALRLYLIGSPVMNAEDLRFSDKGVDEVYKKVMLILYNTLNFYESYGINKVSVPKTDNLMDLWILSRTEEFGKNFTNNLDKYDTVRASFEIKRFVDDLSTWYVRLSRDRFNKEEKEAKQTLGYVLDRFSKVVAPVIPFASEHIYQTLNDKKGSVHLEEYPEFSEKKIDKHLLEGMEEIRNVVSEALKIRDRERVSLKWPLSKVTIKVKDPLKLKQYEEILLQELNVKSVVMKKGDKIEVEFDLKMNKELESEGYSRELARKVQAERKNRGMTKDQTIKMEIYADEEMVEMLEMQKEFLKERVNASKLSMTSDKEPKDSLDCTIKNKRISVVFS